MNWVLVALGVITNSVVLYLAIRKSKELNIVLELRNMSMFLLPAILFFVYNVMQNLSFSVSFFQLAILMGSSLMFSWLGNMASLKALEIAPNPGYSLIISKSYVVMTTILSLWLFDARLTLKDVVALGLIVGFSGVIIIEKGKKSVEKRGKAWMWLTMVAFLAWGFLALTLKYLTGTGLNSTVILFYLMSFVSILIVVEMFVKKVKIKLESKSLVNLLVVGLASTLFNLCIVVGYKLAPNPGYINAANAGSIGLVTIFSRLVFKDELKPKKMIGVVGVLIGLGLLFLK